MYNATTQQVETKLFPCLRTEVLRLKPFGWYGVWAAVGMGSPRGGRVFLAMFLPVPDPGDAWSQTWEAGRGLTGGWAGSSIPPGSPTITPTSGPEQPLGAVPGDLITAFLQGAC